jgi:hypothetical protein
MSSATYPPPAYYGPPEPSLPIGVAILAVLIGIVGFFVFIVGLLVVFAVGGAGLLAHSAGLSYIVGFGGGLVLAIAGLIILGVAVGLWHQRLWALVLAILVVGFLLVEDFLTIGVGTFFTIGGIILTILLIYLIAVHRHFG